MNQIVENTQDYIVLQQGNSMLIYIFNDMDAFELKKYLIKKATLEIALDKESRSMDIDVLERVIAVQTRIVEKARVVSM